MAPKSFKDNFSYLLKYDIYTGVWLLYNLFIVLSITLKGTIDAHGLEIVEKKNEIMTNNRSMDYDWGKGKEKGQYNGKN